MRLSRFIILLIPAISSLLFASCFTGVEGTKRIEIGRDERKQVAPTAEELLLQPVKGVPVGNWNRGKRFIVSDSRMNLISETTGPESPRAGDTLIFERSGGRTMPDGTVQAVLQFRRTGSDAVILYPTGKEYSKAMASLGSDQLPMLTDIDMIEQTRGILTGRHLYTLTSLWYDINGKRHEGKKYVPVTVTDVSAGNATFPLTVTFTDADSHPYIMYMNFGNSGFESRAFANLFSMSEIRARYPSISDDHWRLICASKVCPGMTKDECRLALGNPSDVSAGHDYSRTLDLWQYPDGTFLRFADGILVDFRR